MKNTVINVEDQEFNMNRGLSAFVSLTTIALATTPGVSGKVEDRALVLQAGLMASSPFRQFDSNAISVTVPRLRNLEAIVKFYPVDKVGALKVTLHRNLLESRWKAISVIPRREVSKKVLTQRLDPFHVIAEAMPKLFEEPWMLRDTFRITVVSAGEKEFLFRVSVDPHYEWNSRYIKVARDGSVLARWTGY